MDFLSVAVITILNFFIYATVAMGVRFVIVSYFKMGFVLCYISVMTEQAFLYYFLLSRSKILYLMNTKR